MASNKAKAKLKRFKLHGRGVRALLISDELRPILIPYADPIYNAIPASDGLVGGKRQKGVRQVSGRYAEKFKDTKANGNDGRAAVHVGVKDADRGFFRLMTLQKAVKASGAKARRAKRAKKGGR